MLCGVVAYDSRLNEFKILDPVYIFVTNGVINTRTPLSGWEVLPIEGVAISHHLAGVDCTMTYHDAHHVLYSAYVLSAYFSMRMICVLAR
jgi:hypothetical protein